MGAPLRRLPLALAAAATALLSGCGLFKNPTAREVNHWLAEDADLAAVRRIMVLPFATATGVKADTHKLRDVFTAELLKLQRFEVIPLPEGAREDQALAASVTTGRLSTQEIVALANRYHLDGVVVGTITSWRPYKPPQLGLRTQLISVHSGAPVWAADAYYDAGDGRTVEDLQHYAQRAMAEDSDHLHGWEILMISPTKFASFVSYRLASTWRH